MVLANNDIRIVTTGDNELTTIDSNHEDSTAFSLEAHIRGILATEGIFKCLMASGIQKVPFTVAICWCQNVSTIYRTALILPVRFRTKTPINI